jgi:hypothetical protein
MHRVVLPGLESGVVPPAALAVRHRAVVLLDPADDLFVQRVLQRPERRHHRIGVGVLGLEVVEHLLRLAAVVAQPVVRVAALGAVRGADHVRLLRGVGRRREFAGVDSRGHQQGNG